MSNFNWDKKLPAGHLNDIADPQKNLKIATIGKNNAYIGRSLSTGDKWKKGLEIAGIIVGTMLIIPIPILALTDSYKRLARLNTELKNNISVKAKINDLASEIINNEDKILNGRLKINDNKILERIKASKCGWINGTVSLEIVQAKGTKHHKIGMLEYEFHYDASKPENERFSKKLVKGNLDSEVFRSKKGENIAIYPTVSAKDKNGKLVDYLNYTGGELYERT